MKCVLPTVNIKLFAKAIHCIAKIGSEIYFEPLESGLTLKTVNSSRSAYMYFCFMKPMFQTYNLQHSPNTSTFADDDDNLFKCKIPTKTILQVFKSLHTIERSVESCEINFNDEECRLIFELRCKHGITKTHKLSYQEYDSLEAVFTKDLSPNILKCDSKLLSDIVVNFSSGLEELTMDVTPCQILLKSFVHEAFTNDPANIMKTEMSLNPEEFTGCQVGVDTAITFCLKDLRAILGFCDVANLPVEMCFESGGKPLIFSLEDDTFLRANFVLATISNNSYSQTPANKIMSNFFSKSMNCSKFHNRPTSGKTMKIKNNETFNENTSVNKHSIVSKHTQKNFKKPKLNSSLEPDQNVSKQLLKDPNLEPCNRSNGILGNWSPEIPLQPMQDKYENVRNVFFRSLQDMTQIDCEPLVLAPESDEEQNV